jgi:hypothetical protein
MLYEFLFYKIITENKFERLEPLDTKDIIKNKFSNN